METFAHPAAQHPGDLDALCVASRLGNSYTLDKAHRTAREVRAARLRRLWERTSRAFHEARFASGLAETIADKTPENSPAHAEACRLLKLAGCRMDHLMARARKLAMAEIELALRPIPGGLDAC